VGKAQTKFSDSGGLTLLVTAGETKVAKVWQVRYRFAGREQTLSLGAYPHVTLADARAARDAAKVTLATGRDPLIVKRIAKAELLMSADLSP